MDLTSLRCEACTPGAPMVTDDELEELQPQIPDWERIEVNGVRRLRRSFKVDGWMPAVRLTNAIAGLAEQEDHHPSIRLEWGKVTVQWWTHAIKGLHRNDLIMAAKTDEAFAAHQAAEAGPAH